MLNAFLAFGAFLDSRSGRLIFFWWCGLWCLFDLWLLLPTGTVEALLEGTRWLKGWRTCSRCLRAGNDLTEIGSALGDDGWTCSDCRSEGRA